MYYNDIRGVIKSGARLVGTGLRKGGRKQKTVASGKKPGSKDKPHLPPVSSRIDHTC